MDINKVILQYSSKRNFKNNTKLRVFFLFIVIFQCIDVFCQYPDSVINKINPYPTIITDDSERRNTPAIVITWDKNTTSHSDSSYSFTIESPVSYSFFGIGWKCNYNDVSPRDFIIRYRTKAKNHEWTDWAETYGETSPYENSSQSYQSEIIFVNDSILHKYCEFILLPPKNIKINFVKADFVDMKTGSKIHPTKQKYTNKEKSLKKSDNCPLPDIIPRSEWCGGNSPCQNPTFTPTIIHPTHVIMHHGASPDTYSDGYSVVRSYWNYHVYTNGWDDIGYNFLVDKYGNIFQGRHNPDIINQDINGAHAGYTNGKSIGICFLGNSDVTNATEIQLSKTEELLAWWFNSRGFDPTTKDSIINQAGTYKLLLPRISGHRDVKPATLCPGDNVYSLLPNIRTETQKLQNACSGNSVAPKIKIYPNPTTQKITLEIKDFKEGNVTIKIYSVYGIKKHGQSGKYVTNKIDIDLSSCPRGIYILKININGESFSEKIRKL